jgi:hypothetical protein
MKPKCFTTLFIFLSFVLLCVLCAVSGFPLPNLILGPYVSGAIYGLLLFLVVVLGWIILGKNKRFSAWWASHNVKSSPGRNSKMHL